MQNQECIDKSECLEAGSECFKAAAGTVDVSYCACEIGLSYHPTEYQCIQGITYT